MKKIIKIGMGLMMLTTSLFAVKDYQLRAVEHKILQKKLPNCINVKSYYDKVYCSMKVYSVLDDVLNKEYREVRKHLSRNQKNRLRKVQMNWIHNRDKKCANISRYGNITVDMTCAKKQTLESILYLQEMKKNPNDFELILREYKNGE